MAHRIIGYYTLSQLDKLLNKPFYFYYKSQYCYGIEITDISSTEADAKFAIAVYPVSSGNYLMGIITSARTAFDVTYRGVSKYDSYPYGNIVDPPKDPDSTWLHVYDYGSNTSTITPSSYSGPIYPYTAMNFIWASISVDRYADSDGCVMIWDDNGILNDWDTSIAYSSANFKSYVTDIMGHPAIPPKGQGTVTLDVPANGKTLTFTSQATGEVKSVLVSGNMTVDIRPS